MNVKYFFKTGIRTSNNRTSKFCLHKPSISSFIFFFAILSLLWVCDSKSDKRFKAKPKNFVETSGINNIKEVEVDSFKTTSDSTLIKNLSSASNSTTNSISCASWNIENFGVSKSNEVIEFIANVIKSFDVVVIQEVVAGPGGPQAVARLAAALNIKGAKWDYCTSDPTSGDNSYKRERYAYLWKTTKLKKGGDAWLERQYNMEIDREPYFANFNIDGRSFTLVNFHAITKKNHPETEVKYFKFLPNEYPSKNLIFCGDFNLPEKHTVFNPLKSIGYTSALINQKTSLKEECKGEECLASEFDNFFFKRTKVKSIRSGIIPFYKSFSSLKEARLVSDHVPIFFEFSLLN